MNAIGIALVWCVIQVSLLAAVTALLYRFVRRSGPPARALVAFGGLVVIAGLTGLAFSPWPDWKFQRNPNPNVELAASRSAHGLTGDNPSSAPAADESPESRPDQEQSRLTNDPQAPTAASIFIQALLEELGRAPAAAERET